ncbi:hypothetical protein JOC78_001353 [Bacillus ectoiniformans]|uniref:hypothetical protein n=1 Tax=Bacillus ectoiniformans TaxID=1494429 RepID=UPI001956B7E2|nr:hypothetical protein [Bacillus ectoiniformans]MBM7648411.1 hypothetical protein [Bacillus ectoiniformans]
MKISTNSIIQKIDSDFTSIYKPFSKFPNSGHIWDSCIKAVQDEKLMSHIIFCNDVLQIPPVKVFLKATNTLDQEFTNFEKKAIGAFWGFIFKFVFNYRLQKDNVPIHSKGVKKAAYFYDVADSVEITKE